MMMVQNQILSRIFELLSHIIGEDYIKLLNSGYDESTKFSELKISSLEKVQLYVAVEECFEVEIDENFEFISDLVQYIINKGGIPYERIS